MIYHFKTHKEDGEFWAECIELKGCYTQGRTLPKLLLNMREALDLYLDEPENSKVVFPSPLLRCQGNQIVEIPVSPAVAFSMLLRQSRLKHGYTQKKAAGLLGVKNLYSYQRLESARSANPALSTLVKVKNIFPEIDTELIFPGHGH